MNLKLHSIMGHKTILTRLDCENSGGTSILFMMIVTEISANNITCMIFLYFTLCLSLNL